MELAKNFQAADAERKWTEHWKNRGYFRSKPDGRKPFTVVIPPPNVTGVLHMGHTLNETVQDVLIRRARMQGFNACWVPGSDHASIATEAKVVQMLKEKGIDKHDLSREEFLGYAFEWKDKYGGIIYNQIERLGCSVDWERVSFTMDDHYYEAVMNVFVDLYEKGLIYRGARMINWDPAAQTALSDEEVEYRDVEGKLYYVRYELIKPDGTASGEWITIATQRPETIMGDTAVCVNPQDERYAGYRGYKVRIPLVNRLVPLIFDAYVDPAFGTGALKVTPAHDINDYNLGLKHNLDVVDTLNPDGTLSAAAEVFVGEDRFHARDLAIKKLAEESYLLKEESYQTRLGFSQRTNSVVEPRISTQWFVKMKELAQPALDAVVSGKIRIHPEERFLNLYRYWLENVKDWCISRQLWWGQRIPAWYDEQGNFVVAVNENEARKKYEQQYGTDQAAANRLTQDEDVLDTWFSSWLWPIEVFKGITEPGNGEFRYYYPTSVLVTGQDIIFFWVSRMIMAGMEFKQEIPFEHVYFTGMVRDKLGRKMSKSLGNSPDLLNLIDTYGADAVRFGILISSPAGNDLLFDESSLEQGRNFTNKIWNALKLVNMWKQAGAIVPEYDNEEMRDRDLFAARWFAQRLTQARTEVDGLLKDFRLSEALKKIYSLVWDDFCSWYLEWAKPGYGQQVNQFLLDATLEFFEELMALLHPYMPFFTEEVYSLLRERSEDEVLSIRQVQTTDTAIDTRWTESGEILKELISQVRDVRSRQGLKPRDPITLFAGADSLKRWSLMENILLKQTAANELKDLKEAPARAIRLVVGKDELFIHAEGKVLDTGAQKEQLQKDLAYYEGFLMAVEKKLGNERFMQNAKPEVIELERKKKEDAESKIRTIRESLAAL